MAPIQTYVFLDLETTGMPCQQLNKTKIIELSMLVVKRRHILDTRAGELPRVQHKLTMCLNPGRMIDPGATETSGLCNELLEHETKFNINVFNTIKYFLACQEKPLCLIAQNGYAFDFPIIKNHFEKLNVSLDEDVMCADSLHAFYDIIKLSSVGALSWSEQNSGANGEPDQLLFNKTVNNNEVSGCSWISNVGSTTALGEVVPKDISPKMQNQNETTPKSKSSKVSPKNLKQVKRRIYFDEDPKPYESYKLRNIYKRIFNRRGHEAHRAENDCMMTAEIGVAKALDFVKWVDNNHCAFSEVKAMTLGVPLGH